MTTSVMKSTDCGCGNGNGTASSAEGLERTRYYPRQLVNAEDLTPELSKRLREMTATFGRIRSTKAHESSI